MALAERKLRTDDVDPLGPKAAGITQGVLQNLVRPRPLAQPEKRFGCVGSQDHAATSPVPMPVRLRESLKRIRNGFVEIAVQQKEVRQQHVRSKLVPDQAVLARHLASVTKTGQAVRPGAEL